MADVDDLRANLDALKSHYDQQREWLVRQEERSRAGCPDYVPVPPEAIVGRDGHPILAPMLIAIMQTQAVLAQLDKE